MVVVEVVVSLTGGAPWGFRLQGGAEHHKPLQVAKVRRRSKACRAGLKVDDELVAIEDHKCEELSHCAAMSLIDTQRTTLSLRVKRASTAVHSSSRSTSPRCSAKLRSPSDASSSSPPHRSSLLHRPRCITSPPDSEAYYGETDSDVDTQTHTHRRQRRTPPHARAPGRYDNQQEETSEMSGYESAPDGGLFLQGQEEEGVGLGEGLPGVPRRELVYQSDWTPPAHTPQTLTPHTLTPTPDQGLVEGEGEEGDSGFQEAGGYAGMTCPPLVSPERAKGALMLGSGRQLVPMVGPQKTPLSDELATTYKDKARQAKLQRGESVVEKQVKEARTKCRSIASLLTDAPNPNSKGVLMFKKRRQRAKKYTLTCFGKATGDAGAETGGETGGETAEEGGSSNLSGSEVDEEGFSASFDATWDSGYLDVLDRKSSACPASTPTTPVANHRAGLDLSTYHSQGCMASVAQSPGLDFFRVDGSACQGSNATQPVIAGFSPAHSPGQMSPPVTALTNGGSVAVSRASVVLSPPPNPSPNPNPNTGLNRTARPFTPGSAQSRLSVAHVLFRPPQPKPTGVTTVTISPHHQSSMPEARRAVSSASLYISPRSANGSCPLSPPPTASFPQPPSAPCAPQAPYSTNPAPFSPNHAPFSHNHTHVYSNHAPFPPSPTPFSPLSTPFSTNSAPFSHNPTPFSPNSAPFSPPVAAQGPPVYPSPAPPFSPPTPQSFQSYLSPPTSAAPQLHTPSQVYIQSQAPPPSAPAFTSVAKAAATASPASREQRIAVPAARTGILQDARRHSGGKKKPMFAAVQNREVSPNPALLSMLQSIDHPTETVPGPGPISAVVMMTGPGAEAGHESGPEDDWLRLGAEACNFLQSQQRGPRPPPVAPKPQLAGRGGELFARRQSQMDRYVVERSPSVAPSLCSPGQTRQTSPTPSLPAAWKYSPNIRAPPPISYNPLLSPSCPPRAQKPQKAEPARPVAGPKRGQKGSIKAVDVMAHRPYQLNASLFTYGGGAPQGSSLYLRQQMPACAPQGPTSTARVYEVKRCSTPPPTATGPALKVIAPRSVTMLGEPLWRSDVDVDAFPLTTPASPPYRPQWTSTPLSPPPPPAPTAPLPLLPCFTPSPSSAAAAAHPLPPMPTFSHLQPPNAGANRQFKSSPDLSPPGVVGGPQSALLTQVPRPRFSTSNLGLQPSIWHPGSNGH